MNQNCSDDLIEFDQKKVKITPAQQADMRNHRDTNRERLHTGLTKNGKPQPDEHIVQGSYAMKTMTQHPDREYDIDDGSAFSSSKLLIGSVAMTPQQAKQMVCDALIAEGHGPDDIKVIKNCVRVTYEAGYHVDIPVYRIISDGNGGKTMEIASENEWRESNPREITEWFQRQEAKTLVKGEEQNPQMRRLTRLLKNYSRTNLGDDDSPTGLVLSVLTGELHRIYIAREDEAFRSLLTNLKARLERDKVVKNPVQDEELTKPIDAARMTKLISQLGKSIERLKVLDTDCSKPEARAVWDEVFKTDFFQGRQESEQAAKGPYTPSITEPNKRTNVRGPGTSA